MEPDVDRQSKFLEKTVTKLVLPEVKSGSRTRGEPKFPSEPISTIQIRSQEAWNKSDWEYRKDFSGSLTNLTKILLRPNIW